MCIVYHFPSVLIYLSRNLLRICTLSLHLCVTLIEMIVYLMLHFMIERRDSGSYQELSCSIVYCFAVPLVPNKMYQNLLPKFSGHVHCFSICVSHYKPSQCLQSHHCVWQMGIETYSMLIEMIVCQMYSLYSQERVQRLWVLIIYCIIGVCLSTRCTWASRRPHTLDCAPNYGGMVDSCTRLAASCRGEGDSWRS